MRTIVVIDAPEPSITLDEAKEHLRVDFDDEKDLITALVAAVEGHLQGPDGWLGRSLAPQRLELRSDSFCDDLPSARHRVSGEACGWWNEIRLPLTPVTGIVSVKYMDPNGAEQTLPADQYSLVGSSLVSLLPGLSWPSTQPIREAVRIQYDAGYAALPPPVRAAMLLMLGDLYRNRETTGIGKGEQTAIAMSVTVEALLAPYRTFI